MRRARVVSCLALASLGCSTPLPLSPPPAASANLVLEAPIERSDEAIPLGNGVLGALLWGGGQVVHVSLDRSDLWDLRAPALDATATWTALRALHEAGDEAGIAARFEAPYEAVPYPTKVAAGRLELDLSGGVAPEQFTLDYAHGAGTVGFADGAIEAFVAATAPVVLLRCRGIAPALRLVRPAVLDALGFAPAREGREEATVWMVQDAPAGPGWAVVAGRRTRGQDLEIAVAVATARDGPDPLAAARDRVERALAQGYADLFLPHRAWWLAFWGQSRVELPDERLQAQYDFAKYLYGAGARAGAPPLALQGPWSGDDGALPPWRGGYLHELSAPFSYLATPAAGLAEVQHGFADWHWQLLPRYRDFARAFYGVGGAVVPAAMGLDGLTLGGPAAFAQSPVHGAWVAHAFWLQWRHGRDAAFLRARAYPFCAEIGTALAALLEPDASGTRRLPLSASPWFGAGSARRWLPPGSSYEQALLQWLFGALAEMAAELKDESAAQRWREQRAMLHDLERDPNGALAVAAGVPYGASHRHFAHAIAIHPLCVLDPADPAAQAVVGATLDGLLARGTEGWTGYSFAWTACLLARAGRAEPALEHLETFARAFVARNGFHLNGDQSDEGLTVFRYRVFTLEGNFLALQAVHEMLLQASGGALTVFPAVSDRWRDVSFENLRADGGYLVSAGREGGETRSLQIVATRTGVLRLRAPFPKDRVVLWNTTVVWDDDVLEVALEKGERLTASVLF